MSRHSHLELGARARIRSSVPLASAGSVGTITGYRHSSTGPEYRLSLVGSSSWAWVARVDLELVDLECRHLGEIVELGHQGEPFDRFIGR